MPKHRCPKNLEELMKALYQPTFSSISLEDISYEKRKQEIREEIGENSEYYAEFMANMQIEEEYYARSLLIKLMQFGRNRDEIIQGINRELDKCWKCRRKYKRFLKKVVHAENDIHSGAFIYNKYISAKKATPYRSVKEVDRDFLRRYQEDSWFQKTLKKLWIYS